MHLNLHTETPPPAPYKGMLLCAHSTGNAKLQRLIISKQAPVNPDLISPGERWRYCYRMYICQFYSTMAISTRLSLVVMYLFTAISSVHILTNHGSAEYLLWLFIKHNTMPKWHGLYALLQVITNRLCYRHTPV